MSSKEETDYDYEEYVESLIASQHGQSSCPPLWTNPQPPRAPHPKEATPTGARPRSAAPQLKPDSH
jgi:hypothetical protein